MMQIIGFLYIANIYGWHYSPAEEISDNTSRVYFMCTKRNFTSEQDAVDEKEEEEEEDEEVEEE